MRKTIIAASLACAAFAVPNLAAAQAAPAAASAPTPDFTFTGNAGLFSSYRFRGIDQTFGKPAIQGGLDFSHVSGIYLGNWNSNVNQGAGYPGGNIEMDFYGGWKKTWDDWGLDLGGIYYYYPGTNSVPNTTYGVLNNRNSFNGRPLEQHSGKVDNGELYIAGSWKWISLKYSHAMTDYFSVPKSKGSSYWDLTANYDLGDGWGINGHVGHLNFKNEINGDYTDWKLGVTKDLGGWVKELNGWVVGASYIDTNAKGNCSTAATATTNSGLQPYCFGNGNTNVLGGADKTKNAGRGIAVVSISKTF
jgi:uncharacterized protein (TIGR02001 family)